MSRRSLLVCPLAALLCLLAGCGKQIHTSESPTSDALSTPAGSEQKAPQTPGPLTPPPPPQPGQMRR